MKKAQTTVEYIIYVLLIVVICSLISSLWNRNAIIQGATFGVEDNQGAVHVRPMTD